MSDVIDRPGFADPVADAQRCFRAVLQAMARPGSLHEVGLELHPPPPLAPATAAVLLTLVDGETSLWLAPGLASTRPWIEFHCGVVCVSDLAAASFILSPRLPDLTRLPMGTYETPQSAATVILQVNGLGAGLSFRLRGPGLRTPGKLAVDGLPADFAAIWSDNHARFPCGIDLILCAGLQVAALPRSVMIEEA
jgi:alpha-D-ribose 1-methylphosphonate 5-triphosphate synthase subunit PhnH